jgi:hypothetical protein
MQRRAARFIIRTVRTTSSQIVSFVSASAATEDYYLSFALSPLRASCGGNNNTPSLQPNNTNTNNNRLHLPSCIRIYLYRLKSLIIPCALELFAAADARTYKHVFDIKTIFDLIITRVRKGLRNVIAL